MNNIKNWLNGGLGKGTLQYFYERGFDDGFIDSMGFKSTEEALLELNDVAKNVEDFPGAILMKGDLDDSLDSIKDAISISSFFPPSSYANPAKIYIESFNKLGIRTGISNWIQISNPYPVDTPELNFYFRSSKARSEPLFYNFFLAIPRVYLQEKYQRIG